MSKKKKILIPILIILIILLVGIILFVTFYKKDTKKDLKYDDETIRKRIIELIDNSYTYYLLKEGFIPLGEGKIEKDNEVYYVINDKKIKKLSNIINLINDTFTETASFNRYNELFEKQKFVEVNNHVYVKLSDQKCKLTYEIDKDKFKYSINSSDNLSIWFYENSIEFTAYYNEGKWKLRMPIYDCDLNIDTSELEKENKEN